MILEATAPTRISLFGGGTDLPVYYEKHEGHVLSFAINLYQRMRIDTGTSHYHMKIPKGASRLFYRAFFDEYGVDPENFEFNAAYDGKIPGGLGSSASAAVCLVGLLARYTGRQLSSTMLAERAWEIENYKLQMYGGKQDEYAATYGGVNFLTFQAGGVRVETYPNGQILSFLLPHLVFVYTGHPRKDADIQEELKSLSTDQTKALHQIKQAAIEGRRLMLAEDLPGIGQLLHETWIHKKRSNHRVSNEHIDYLYHKAMVAGAYGGKICGSGGGGYAFFIAKPGKKTKLIKALKQEGCTVVPVEIDGQGLEVRRMA